MLTNFKRIIKYGFLGLIRNGWLTVSAVVVMIITLLVLSALLVINQLAEVSAANLQSRVSISVFLAPQSTEEKLNEVKDDLSTYEEVSSVIAITADEALENFRRAHQNDPLIEQSLTELEENPLQPSLVITAKQLELYPVIHQKLQRSRFIQIFEKINYEDNRELISRLESITEGIRNFGIALTIVFGLIAMLVMFNTLRLTIFSRREEIEIMRLVGASNSFVRGPFIVEGIFYGLMATLIAILLMYPALSYIEPFINSFLGINLGTVSFLSNSFWQLALIQLGVGVGLGVISSIIATKKYLKI